MLATCMDIYFTNIQLDVIYCDCSLSLFGSPFKAFDCIPILVTIQILKSLKMTNDNRVLEHY